VTVHRTRQRQEPSAAGGELLFVLRHRQTGDDQRASRDSGSVEPPQPLRRSIALAEYRAPADFRYRSVQCASCRSKVSTNHRCVRGPARVGVLRVDLLHIDRRYAEDRPPA
jgi:hypothetical protein